MRTSLLVACLLALFGCGGPSEDAASPTSGPKAANADGDIFTLAMGTSTDSPAMQHSTGPEDGISGEDTSTDNQTLVGGCAHIQWCNEPGPVGTVCIWDACTYDAAYRECVADAKYVCGKIIQPAQIR